MIIRVLLSDKKNPNESYTNLALVDIFSYLNTK